MRHVTAHISIWNKLGWIGIICYFVFAAAAPEVLTEGNQWIGLCLAVLCVTLIFPAMEEAVQCDCAGRHGDMDHRHAGDSRS